MPDQEQKIEVDQESAMTTAQDHASTLKQEIVDELYDIEQWLSEAEPEFQKLNQVVKFYDHELQHNISSSTESTLLELMESRLAENLELQNNEAKRTAFLERRKRAKQKRQPIAEHKTSQTTETSADIEISPAEKENFLKSVRSIVTLCQKEVTRLEAAQQEQQNPAQNRVTVQAKTTSLELAMISAKKYNEKLLQEVKATMDKLKESYKLYGHQLRQIELNPPSKKTDLVTLLKDILATNQELLKDENKRNAFLRKRIKEGHKWNPQAKGEFLKSVQKIVDFCQKEIERLEYQSEQDQETTASLDEEIYRAQHAAKKELSKIKDNKLVKTTTRAAKKQEASETALQEIIAYCQNELNELKGQPPLEMSFKDLISSRLRELKNIGAGLKEGKRSKILNKEKSAHQKSILRMTRFYEKIIARLEQAKPEQFTTWQELKDLEDFLKDREQEREDNQAAYLNDQWNFVNDALTRNNELAAKEEQKEEGYTKEEQREASRASKKEDNRPVQTLADALNGGRSGTSRPWTPRGSKVGPKARQPAAANGQSAPRRRSQLAEGAIANGHRQSDSRRKSQLAAGASPNGKGQSTVQALSRPGAESITPLTAGGRPPTPKPTTKKSTRTIWGGKKDRKTPRPGN